MRRALALPMLLVASCAAETVPIPARPTAVASGDPTPPAPKRPQTCPLVPLDLVLHTPDGQTRTMLSLAPTGEVRESLMGIPKPLARLDPRGCLVSPDGVEVDVGRGPSIWTPHEHFDFSSSTLRLESGRSVRIESSGEVVALSADGSVEPTTYGGFAFNGYEERAACAARVLLVTFFRMMPSMAVSDGHPKVLPPPEDSSCAELHRGK